jgi:hypothetical protein
MRTVGDNLQGDGDQHIAAGADFGNACHRSASPRGHQNIAHQNFEIKHQLARDLGYQQKGADVGFSIHRNQKLLALQLGFKIRRVKPEDDFRGPRNASPVQGEF